MRIVFVAHGYPPRENAGTEQHTAALAGALRRRGHRVHVLAATRAPGRAQYSLLEEPGVTRIVNNLPARPLSMAERDPAVEAITGSILRRFQPEIVHVQHLQSLSSRLPIEVPVVLTLHDGWTWCAAGGLELAPDGSACPGPDPGRCAPCAAAWAPVPGRAARGLVAVAGRLSPLVDPDRLHRLYRRLPARLRARVHREASPVEGPEAARRRNEAMLDFARKAACRIAPSRFLARRAEMMGLGPVRVLPHGAEPGLPRSGGGPILFLGTIARHKGPDLVVRAWRRAFPGGDPGLALHGPVADPALALGHPVGPVLSRAEVQQALSRARALVMGSRWAENAPLVLIEARSAGCPVVAPAIGGIPELVEPGRDGILYPPGDEDALVTALQDVVHRPPGPVRPPWPFEAQVEATEAIYSELAGGCG